MRSKKGKQISEPIVSPFLKNNWQHCYIFIILISGSMGFLSMFSKKIVLLAPMFLIALSVFVFMKQNCDRIFSAHGNNAVNKDVERPMCDLELRFGEMCPKFYTELGGKCDLDKKGFNCPDIRRMNNKPLRQAQLVLTRILRIFDLIAKKHGIRYWLSSGTLIGAARHKGFIPWDHDVDIEMPMKDYIKFYRVGSKDLPPDVFYHNSKTDPNLRPNDSSEEHSLAHKEIGLYLTPWNHRLRDETSCYGYCLRHGCKWRDGLMVDLFVSVRRPGDVFPLKEMEFEGFVFPVPNTWRQILLDDYGNDVLSIPDEEQRIPYIRPHPIRSCEQLSEEGYEFE